MEACVLSHQTYEVTSAQTQSLKYLCVCTRRYPLESRIEQ